MSTPPRERKKKIAANWPTTSNEDEYYVDDIAGQADELRGDKEQALYGAGVERRPRDHGGQGNKDEDCENPLGPVARPIAHAAFGAIGGEHPVRPEVVVRAPVLADDVVDLSNQLSREKDSQPPLGVPGLDEPVVNGEQRVRRKGVPEQKSPNGGDQDEQPGAHPERPRLSCFVTREHFQGGLVARCCRHLGRRDKTIRPPSPPPAPAPP